MPVSSWSPSSWSLSSRRAVLALFLSCCGLLLAASFAQAQQQTIQAPDSSKWNEPTEPFRIVGPVHYVGTSELAAYLIATPEGHVLIDGGLKESAPLIERSIRTLGFKVEDIKVLLITQGHFDHVASLAQLQRASRARVEVMQGDASLLESGGRADYLFHRWGESAAFDTVKPTRLLKDGDTVTLGGVTLTARATPGHTPGCTTWTTTVQDRGKAYRVVFTGSTAVNGGTRLVGQESYPGITRDFQRSLAMLESLPVDIFLAAHTGAFGMPAKRDRMKAAAAANDKTAGNPFVDPEGFKKYIAASKATFERLLAEQQAEQTKAAPPK